MGPTGKGQMAVGLARDVKFRWIVKHFRVAVGGTDAQVQVGARRDHMAADRDFGGGFAVAELVGRGHAEDLFNCAGNEGWIA